MGVGYNVFLNAFNINIKNIHIRKPKNVSALNFVNSGFAYLKIFSFISA
jgi:glutamate formiminotransferase